MATPDARRREEPPVSKRTEIREESADDVDAVRRVVAAAFGGEKVPELLDAFRESVAWLDLAYVVEEEGEVVASICYTRAWLDAPTKLVEVLALSPLAVRPDRQRTGIGSGLVKETLRLVEGRPEPLVFLEGSPDFYSRLGFIAAGELGFSAPSARIPVPAFQVATLPGYDQTWMSGAVVYPDVLWRLDSVGLRPER
jgi:putative acetyltransferase